MAAHEAATAALQNQKEVPGLWLARAKPGAGLKSAGSYWPVTKINILVQADKDRHAQKAVIAFPEPGAAFVVRDQAQLKAIIQKLITAYQHIGAGPRAQSSVVGYDKRFG